MWIKNNKIMNIKPIGGVRGVTLCFSTDENKRSEIDVPLVVDSSEYIQQVDCTRAIVVVSHLLTLVSERRNALPWIDLPFLERAAMEGVIATVVLNDGRVVDVGSKSAPLRIVSLKDASGTSCSQTPTVTLTLKCENINITE